MKILMISKSGDGLGIAQKLVEEGNEVKVYIKEGGYKWAGQGIVDRITSWRPVAGDWADLVVADMVGFGSRSTVLDGFNVAHVGFNEMADLLELDRQKQMDIFEKISIKVPETWQFDSPGAALDLLDVWRGRGYVVKPSGNIETAKTYMCFDKDTYRWALEQYSGTQELIAQRIVEGVEISTEGWFNGVDWIEPFNHTMEEKRFLNGNKGPMTGCMGNVVWTASDGDKLVDNLKKLTPLLRRIKHKGPIDLNTIVNEDGVFALELTTRFGYDAIEALYELMNEPLGAALLALSSGGKAKLSMDKESVGLAVRVTLPPYPHSDADPDDRGLPVMPVPQSADGLRPFFLTDVYKDGDLYRWSASDGVVMKVTGKANTIEAARAKVYGKIDKVNLMNAQFRTDVGLRFNKDMEKLHKLGMIEPGKFRKAA